MKFFVIYNAAPFQRAQSATDAGGICVLSAVEPVKAVFVKGANSARNLLLWPSEEGCTIGHESYKEEGWGNAAGRSVA